MGRGGHRDGAGRKSGWNHADTQTIRVPKVFAVQLMDIARRLDLGESENLVSSVPPEADPVQPIVESEIPQVNPDQMDLFELIPEVIESVTESKSLPSKPDGFRWLSSEQAWKIAKDRGCERNLEGFRKWGKRHPDLCSELYGLRKLPSPPKGNTVAPAFEDLQYEEFDPDQHF
jgi:hypothetical protein